MKSTPLLFGYVVVLVPPALLCISTNSGHPWLTCICFVLASPVTRFLVGVYRPRPLVVSEMLASLLHKLPWLYVATLAICLPASAAALADISADRPLDLLGFGVSLWTVLTFGTFPAHELLHRRNKSAAIAGSICAGACGYPILGLEHVAHHLNPGRTAVPEWAKVNESVWSFCFRRIQDALRTAASSDSAMRRSQQWLPALRPLTAGVATWAATSLMFFSLAGVRGLWVYGAACVDVVLAIQIMTYVQHWGLGDDSFPDAHSRELAWEDDCLMQAWLTMNDSFHMAHHREPETPYYFLQPAPTAPRQPGCYVVMLHACLVPSIWRRLMRPVLEAFVSGSPLVCEPGRRALCITPTRRLDTPSRESVDISGENTS